MKKKTIIDFFWGGTHTMQGLSFLQITLLKYILDPHLITFRQGCVKHDFGYLLTYCKSVKH